MIRTIKKKTNLNRMAVRKDIECSQLHKNTHCILQKKKSIK